MLRLTPATSTSAIPRRTLALAFLLAQLFSLTLECLAISPRLLLSFPLFSELLGTFLDSKLRSLLLGQELGLQRCVMSTKHSHLLVHCSPWMLPPSPPSASATMTLWTVVLLSHLPFLRCGGRNSRGSEFQAPSLHFDALSGAIDASSRV